MSDRRTEDEIRADYDDMVQYKKGHGVEDDGSTQTIYEKLVENLREAGRPDWVIIGRLINLATVNEVRANQHEKTVRELIHANGVVSSDAKRYRRMLYEMTNRVTWINSGYDATEYDAIVAQFDGE